MYTFLAHDILHTQLSEGIILNTRICLDLCSLSLQGQRNVKTHKKLQKLEELLTVYPLEVFELYSM
jgi:hypothetical protein